MSEESQVQTLLDEIANHPASVYQVGVWRYDCSLGYKAYAHLRHGHGEPGRHFEVIGDTPEQALQALKNTLDAIVCPHCHQRLPEAVK